MKSAVKLLLMMSGAIAPPGAVTNLAVTGASGGTVADLTPEGTCDDIAGATFDWEIATTGNLTGTPTATGQTNAYTFGAQTNHYSYDIGVRAVNAGGPGPWTTVTVHISVFTQALTGATNTNYDFSSWSSNDPVGWTVVNESQPTDYVDESGADGNPGTGAAHVVRTTLLSRLEQTTTVGEWHEWEIARPVNSGLTTILELNNSLQFYNFSDAHHVVYCIRNPMRYYFSGSGEAVFTKVKRSTFTPNDEATAASADGIFEFHFTLPGTPKQNDEVFLFYRADGPTDYWRLGIARNIANSSWDMTLFKLVSGVPTQIISPSSAGAAPNAMRVVTSGNDHTCYVSQNDGGSWTQVSTTKTDSAMASNTGVRAVYQSGVTPRYIVMP